MTTTTDREARELLDANAPRVHTKRLDTLWFQVGGTICNLRCRHCLISCSPENDAFGFMSREMCDRYLEQARALGVKEFYFTGGEPFANPELCDILERALQLGPTTVLTNATLFREETLDRLERMRREATHSLEIRVSLDGSSAQMNDPIRGAGTFDRAMEGTRRLVERGFEPIITITRTWDGCDAAVLADFRRSLAGIGYEHPRLKIMPSIKLGAELQRTCGYCPEVRITHAMMEHFDERQLLCSSTRLVTDRGVWVCPILLDSAEARMGDTLSESIRDHPLRHAACFTCYEHGAICSNTTCTEAYGPRRGGL